MARIKGAVNAKKSRRKVFKLAKGLLRCEVKAVSCRQRTGHALLRYTYVGRRLRSAISASCGSLVSTRRFVLTA